MKRFLILALLGLALPAAKFKQTMNSRGIDVDYRAGMMKK